MDDVVETPIGQVSRASSGDQLTSPWHQPPASASSLSMEASEDTSSTFTKFFGESGIGLRVHCTYGGNLRVHLRFDLHIDVELAKGCNLGVSLPVTCEVTDLKFDGTIIVKAHGNSIGLSVVRSMTGASPLTHVNILAQFGSVLDTPYVDEEKVSEFVIAQVRTLLDNALVEPNELKWTI
eukprot:PhM_4_TR8222/c0_g1_i2/m.5853